MAAPHTRLSPDCACSACRLIYPIEPCHYCTARSINSQTICGPDGVALLTRFICANCFDPLQREHERGMAVYRLNKANQA